MATLKELTFQFQSTCDVNPQSDDCWAPLVLYTPHWLRSVTTFVINWNLNDSLLMRWVFYKIQKLKFSVTCAIFVILSKLYKNSLRDKQVIEYELSKSTFLNDFKSQKNCCFGLGVKTSRVKTNL